MVETRGGGLGGWLRKGKEWRRKKDGVGWCYGWGGLSWYFFLCLFVCCELGVVCCELCAVICDLCSTQGWVINLILYWLGG